MLDSHAEEACARALAAARRVIIITGAGVSAESGIPTYRGVSGLYEGAVTDEGMPIEEALSGTTFKTRPDVTWKYLRQVEAASRGAQPNAAHLAITELEGLVPHLTVLTQNVDGLHTRAGTKNVIEIHGNARKVRCTNCTGFWVVDSYEGLDESCPGCGSPVRPEVVLFGELLPLNALARLRWESEQGFDVAMVVGTTAIFPYIQAPILTTVGHGGTAFEVNPLHTEASHLVTGRVRAPAGEALPRILERLRSVKSPR